MGTLFTALQLGFGIAVGAIAGSVAGWSLVDKVTEKINDFTTKKEEK
jgi:ABC-type dipeptide/oligopeptide/nickel transport system permease subunit